VNSFLRVMMLCVLGVLWSGCASNPSLINQYTNQCTAPNLQLSEAWTALEKARTNSGGCRGDGLGHDQCDLLQQEIERIAYVCPQHVPSLMATSVLAFQAGKRTKAQQYLDSILTIQEVHPEAAMLRARIALEEGNLPFAREFVSRHLLLSPDQAGLHELYAAVLFLSDEFEGAKWQLEKAERLGAPRWRVAYHLGLFEERQGHPKEARRLYKEATKLKPEWQQPRARLQGLLAVPLSKGSRSTSTSYPLETSPFLSNVPNQ